MNPLRLCLLGVIAACALGLPLGGSDGRDPWPKPPSSAPGRTFHVDAQTGRDEADGRSPERAWRSLERVNDADLKPGDTVCFKRGGVWRGSLLPVSGAAGAPVTYTAYGQGAKPLLLGSRPRNRPGDWVRIRDNLWATLPLEYHTGKQLVDLRSGRWSMHQEAGARVELSHGKDPAGQIVRLACTKGGSAANHLQLWGPTLRLARGDCLLLTFRARCSKPFRIPGVEVMRSSAPYTRFARSNAADRPLATDWETFRLVIHADKGAEEGRLHLSLGGLLPASSVLELQPQSLHTATPSLADPLSVDVGNLIFDQGAVCGWKKWSIAALSKPYDYTYDRASQRVYLHLADNPAAKHRSIELALARHVVDQSGKHHVVYDGLAVMNGAAHGFGGGNTHHLVIRNCDLGYIGGAHQLTRADGTPVRYGNAIEFWGAARDHLVEGCHIREVYDAALTNQGRSPDSHQINITYRNNVIRNAEYSFEYWNHPESAVTKNIRFVNNTCVHAGRTWAHAQRPDPNGSHLMFYSNTAATSGVEVKYNVFYDVTDWGCRYTSDWKVLPEIDHNLWYSKDGIMAYWFRDKIATFDAYRRTTRLEAHSRFADPKFVDAAKGDYRLGADSPARTLRPDGGPVGAEQLWK